MLLHSDGCLSAVHGDRLHGRITGAPASDGQGRLSWRLGHKSERDNSSLAGDTSCSRRTSCRNLQCPGRWIVAVNKSDGLAILRQESAVRNVDDLQLVGIVVQLQGHGINVLSAREHYIYREGCAFCLGKGGRI